MTIEEALLARDEQRLAEFYSDRWGEFKTAGWYRAIVRVVNTTIPSVSVFCPDAGTHEVTVTCRRDSIRTTLRFRQSDEEQVPFVVLLEALGKLHLADGPMGYIQAVGRADNLRIATGDSYLVVAEHRVLRLPEGDEVVLREQDVNEVP